MGTEGEKSFIDMQKNNFLKELNKQGVVNINESVGVDIVRNSVVSIPCRHCICFLHCKEM